MASLSSTNTRQPPPSWPSTTTTTTTSLREASFSSYLNTSEEAYIRTLIDNPNSRPPKKAEDGEIDVFSADKYFSSAIDHERSNSARSRRKSLENCTEHDHHPSAQVKPSKLTVHQSRTPSRSMSEQSSNSQNALLKRLHRSSSKTTDSTGKAHQQGPGTGSVSGRMSLLPCSCCAKKSVDIDVINKHGSRTGISDTDNPFGYNKGVTRSIKTNLDTAEITRINKLRVDHHTEDPFVFPGSDCAAITKVNLHEDESRKSLDVFGSSDLDEGSKRFSLQKRLNMLSWDAIPRTTTTTEEEVNTSGAPSETNKDTESDASSDLFEIECLSCTANPVIQLQPPRVPSDGCSTPTTGYAPSEASIEWSVVTASAADFSITSEYEDQRSNILPLGTRLKLPSKNSPTGKLSLTRDVQKPVSSILLGCKSQKAVNVAREVHRRTPPRGKPDSQRMNRLSDSFAPVTRFQAEAKLAGFSNHRQRQKSLSPDLLYIQ